MKFIATVENKSEIQLIASKLRELGCSIDSILKLGGIIIGNSNTKRLTDIKIDGVKTVEPERTLGKLNY